MKKVVIAKLCMTACLVLIIGGSLIKIRQNEIRQKKQLSFVKIHQLLFNLYQQCNSNQIDEAENTFLDIQQEWQREDVTYSHPASKVLGYYPSDSLARLEVILNKLARNPLDGRAKIQVAHEIKFLHSKIDQIQFRSGW